MSISDHCMGFSPFLKRLLANSSIIESRSHLLTTSGVMLSGPDCLPSLRVFLAFRNSSAVKSPSSIERF